MPSTLWAMVVPDVGKEFVDRDCVCTFRVTRVILA